MLFRPDTKLEEFNKNKAIVLNSVTNEFKEKVKQYIDNNQEAYHQKNLSLFIAKVKHPQSFDDLTFSNDFKNFCLFPLQQKVKRHRKKRSLYALAASLPLVFVVIGYFTTTSIYHKHQMTAKGVAASTFLFFVFTGLYFLYKANSHENRMQEESYHCSMDEIINVPSPTASAH